MTLQEYLAFTKISLLNFSTICKLSHTTLYNYLKFGKFSKKTAHKINSKTKGMVILDESKK